jgi:hypothetical protein
MSLRSDPKLEVEARFFREYHGVELLDIMLQSQRFSHAERKKYRDDTYAYIQYKREQSEML